MQHGRRTVKVVAAAGCLLVGGAIGGGLLNAGAAGTEGGVQLSTGDCSTFAIPWDHMKPGGPGPM